MSKKEDLSGFSGVKYIFTLLVITGLIFTFSGCLGYPGRYQGPVEPDGSGEMNRSKHYPGSIFYMDQTSSYRGGRFVIRNGRGDILYRVKGDLFSPRRRLSLTTPNGRELYYITGANTGYRSTYTVYSYRRWAVKIYKKRTRNYDEFHVNSRNGKDYKVRGNFMNRIYAFYYKNHPVAHMKKRGNSFSDNYVIEIEPYQNTIAILLTTIVIDMDNMMYPQR